MTDDQYNLESISRFIDSILFNRSSDNPDWLAHAKSIREKQGIPELEVTEDMIAAAFALGDALHGIDLHKKFNLHRQPKKTDRIKTIDKPEYAVVMAAINNEIGRPEAIVLLKKMLRVGERQAERYFDSVKPGAEKTLFTFKQLFKSAGLGEYIVMGEEEYLLKIKNDDTLKRTDKIKLIQKLKGIPYREAQQKYYSLKKTLS